MNGRRHRASSVATVVALACFASYPDVAHSECPTARDLDPSAVRGDAAQRDWLVYRNARDGLSFRHPPSMRVEERDPATFGMADVPDVIIDLVGDAPDNPNVTVMRVICARGERTPEMAVARARVLRKPHPDQRGSPATTMVIDGHDAIVACGCGRAACQWSVTTLQSRECTIFPMGPSEPIVDLLPPPHDGRFPLLSIIKTVHFESRTRARSRRGRHRSN